MLRNELPTDTETLIKVAARKVFLRKGLAGTRMQEIADEAGIGRTALHYYFRSKERLFELVWKDFFKETSFRMSKLDERDMPIRERMQLFASNYMDVAMKTPEIDLFLLNEFNSNPIFFKEVFQNLAPISSRANFTKAIEDAVATGELVGEPQQIMLTFMSLCMFPFAAMGMIKSVMDLSDEAFASMMQQRKSYLLKFLDTAFQA